MFCPDCETDLNSVPDGALCPGCGGGRRSANAQAGVAEGFAVVERVSVEIGMPDPHRPWQQQWRETVHHLGVLERLYHGNPDRKSNASAERNTREFFLSCDHMRDWLIGDLVNLPGLTSKQIKDYFFNDDALQLCQGMSNTSKHHTRRHGTTAWISKTRGSDQGLVMAISYKDDVTAVQHIDALKLARDCVAAWRGFFAAKGIVEP